MKKILVSALGLLAYNSYGQNKLPHQQMVAVRDFMKPYKFYTDKPDTASRLAIISATDNLLNAPYGAVQIKYAEISTKGRVLQGSQGSYNCSGPCYDLWNSSPGNNTAFQIVADSVIRRPIVLQ